MPRTFSPKERQYYKYSYNITSLISIFYFLLSSALKLFNMDVKTCEISKKYFISKLKSATQVTPAHNRRVFKIPSSDFIVHPKAHFKLGRTASAIKVHNKPSHYYYQNHKLSAALNYLIV